MTVRTITLFEKIGAVYIAIPKCGNTSIKSELISFETGDAVNNPHAKALELTTLTPARISGSVRRKNLVFTFVRNPWDRMVSLWADKCGESTDVNLTHWGIEKGMPFNLFVDQVCSLPDEWAEIHFQSQVSLLMHQQRLLPAFIGRFETINRDWDFVKNALALKSEDRGRALPKLRASQHGEYRDYYSATLAMKIGTRYAQDASMFGYTF
jgi:hypothetical protein